jgi:hypothetical protein
MMYMMRVAIRVALLSHQTHDITLIPHRHTVNGKRTRLGIQPLIPPQSITETKDWLDEREQKRRRQRGLDEAQILGHNNQKAHGEEIRVGMFRVCKKLSMNI